jgi:IPT/TIG domain-containing protein
LQFEGEFLLFLRDARKLQFWRQGEHSNGVRRDKWYSGLILQQRAFRQHQQWYSSLRHLPIANTGGAMTKRLLFGTLLLSACGTRAIHGQASVYTLLYSPPSLSTPGGEPTTIFEAAPGLFYVLSVRTTTTFGPSIFTITSTGTFELIYTFPPAVNAMQTFVQATNGSLYGPAGSATTSPRTFYFSLTPSGTNLQEFPFSGSWGSAWQTIVAPPGELYDIVGFSPTSTSKVYGFARVSETGKITILHQFSGSDGAPTGSNLAHGPDGNFYGVGNQQSGGVSPGFIYRFTPSGGYSQLLNFPSFPANGFLPLIAAFDGNLYGLFGAGGSSNAGELYKATLSGKLQLMASFPTQMALPQTLMQASDGNIYGSTNSNYIFRYNLATHALSSAYQLNPNGTQGRCYCPLVQGMDGKLYGVATLGGNYPGIGAVFSLDLGLPKPKPVVSATYPAAGPVGQKVILWGNNLLGATSVTFNGVRAASTLVTSAQSAKVTVPAGATTGPVTITTANGSFTTTQDFTVQ